MQINILIFFILYGVFYIKRKKGEPVWCGEKNVKRDTILTFLAFYIPSVIMWFFQTKSKYDTSRISDIILILGFPFLFSLFSTLFMYMLMIGSSPEKDNKMNELKKDGKILSRVNISKKCRTGSWIFVAIVIILTMSSFFCEITSVSEMIIFLLLLSETIICSELVYWQLVFLFMPLVLSGVIDGILIKDLNCEMIERKTYKLYSRNEKDIILTPIKYDFINNGGKYIKYCPYRSIDLKIVIKDIDYEEIDMFKIQNYIDSLAEEYVSKPSINITKNQNDVELTCDYTLQKNSIYSVFNAIDEFLVIYEMLNKIVDEIVYMAY